VISTQAKGEEAEGERDKTQGKKKKSDISSGVGTFNTRKKGRPTMKSGWT